MLRCRGNTLSRNKRVSTRRPFYCYFFFYVCFSLLLNLVSCSNSAFKQDFSEIKKSYPADLLTKNQKTVGKVEFVKFSCGTGNSSMHGESKVMIHVDMARMATRSLQLRASWESKGIIQTTFKADCPLGQILSKSIVKVTFGVGAITLPFTLCFYIAIIKLACKKWRANRKQANLSY